MALVGTLLFAGAVLLLLETVLPGMVAGIAGVICLIGGVAAGYERFGHPVGDYIFAATLVSVLAGFAVWVKYFPQSKAASWFVSKYQIGTVGAEKPELLNHTGKSITTLRPSGTALIDGKRIDVVSTGSFIEKDRNIRVVGIEGMRVIVEATK